jgi:hypothetical protein
MTVFLKPMWRSMFPLVLAPDTTVAAASAAAAVPTLALAVELPETQVAREATFRLPVPPEVAFPFFGPLGERAWAGPDWAPAFVHPLPAADVEGAVFTTPAHGVPGTTLWVNLRFDAAAGVAEYAHFTPGHLVVRVSVALAGDGAGGSTVKVRYAWTPLSPAGAGSFADRAAGFDRWIAGWQEALLAALVARPNVVLTPFEGAQLQGRSSSR